MGSTYEIDATNAATDGRVPVVMSRGDEELVVNWVAMPDDPTRQPVQIFGSRDAGKPDILVAGSRNRREVSDRSGGRLCAVSTTKSRSLFRTRWSVMDHQGTETFTLTERLIDGFWRRVVRPLPRSLRDGAPDPVSAVLLAPLFAILAVKPWCQLTIRDASGHQQGVAQFASNAKRPRDHLIVELSDPIAAPEGLLLAAAIAATSVMR